MLCFHFQPDCKDPIMSKEIFWILITSIIIVYLGILIVFVITKCKSKKQTASVLEDGMSSALGTFSDDIGSVKQYPDTVIQVQVNGWPCLALVDTGSPISFINKTFLTKIEGKTIRFYSRFLNLVGLNGQSQSSSTLIKTIMKIENKKFKLGLQLNNSSLQTPFDVVLGSDFLKGKIYTEDTLNKTFTISNATTKTIDVNNIPDIKIAVGQANQGYVAIQGVSKTAKHPVYIYDSVDYPGITFTFAWKRNLSIGSTYYCTHCDKAKAIQKSEGRRQGKVATIHYHDGFFTENPDTRAHICFNENVHKTVFKTAADQINRQESRNLRNNPAPPLIAWNNMTARINAIYGADAVHVTNALPKKHKMFRTFNNNSAVGRPDNVDPYAIPENLQHSPSVRQDGRENKIVRYFNHDRNSSPFIIMMDATNLRCIHGASDLIFDGTFQYAPANMPNAQIYTMHASYHDLPDFNNNFLVGIAIVLNKDIPTYERIFNVIKEQLTAEFGDIGQHKTVHMDHEIAAITAAQNVFPDWTLHSCYFHFGKNLRERMGRRLLEADGVGRWFSALCGSCHLPLQWQQEVVTHLMLNLPPVDPQLLPRLGNFAHYFQTFWQPKLPLVNFYGKGGVRTTNAAEGFHNSLNTLFENRQHPSFTTVFLHLRDLLCSHHAEYSKIILNGAGLDLREKLFRESEARIIRATNVINNEFVNNRHPDIELLLSYCRHVALLSTPKVNMERREDYNWNYQPQVVYVFQQAEEYAQPQPVVDQQEQVENVYYHEANDNDNDVPEYGGEDFYGGGDHFEDYNNGFGEDVQYYVNGEEEDGDYNLNPL